MIVTCTACRTQFRISDEMVGPKGAKVRCSKCRAVFTIHRDQPPVPAGLPPPAPPAAEPRATPPPLPVRQAPPAPRPPPPARPEVDLSFDPPAPPAPRHDDPFAPRSPAGGDPFAAGALPPPDPFASSAAPPLPTPLPVPDPFLPPVSDPFAPAGAQGAPATDPGHLGSAATPMPGDGGIALEEAERRTANPTTATGLAALAAEDIHAADFRTPGPSGLEVDEREPPAATPAAEPPRPALQAAPPAPAPRPRVEPEPEPEPEPVAPPAPPPRRVAAILVNSLSLALLLVLAGGLYLYAKGGRAAVWAAIGGETREPPLSAREVRSGLYETAAGPAVLFVRGSVVARAGHAGPVAVRAELVDGGRPVGRAEGLAGAVPTPEEIWRLSGPADADRLRQAVSARAARRLAPGEEVPFLLVVWAPPSDLRGLDLRVVAEPAPGG